MNDAGIENPKKNVWLNKSIYPLNKTFLLGKKAKNTFFTQEAKPKKKCLRKTRQIFGLRDLGGMLLFRPQIGLLGNEKEAKNTPGYR